MTDRPRLFLVTESPAPSGVGEHMLTLAEGLRGDHDIVVAATPASGLLARARTRGLTVKAIDPGNVQDLSRWFARAQPDIVHVHAGIGWEGHASAQAAHAAGARVIRTEHLPYLLTDADQCAAHRAGLTHVDRLIAVSDAVADSHRQAELGNRLTTIPNGVVPSPAPTRPRATLRRYWVLDDGPVLLMAARFAEQKGHRLLLDAMPAIRAAHPRVTLLLAGDGPLKWTIAREIAACGLAGSVRMLGQRDDMPDLMAAADLLVLPSRFEGLSLVALEAMAAGLPVVASDAPGNAEMLEHGRSGWLAPAGDAAAFAATVIDALSDRDRLRAVAIAASDHQRDHHDADRMIRDTAAIYAEETSGAPRPDGKRMTRIGFIGAGGIAHRHFGVLDQFEDVEIVAIADVDQSRADEAAARFGARSFTDIDAMLDAVAVDALYICVPPFAHGAPERAAIERGLPFFVEKPVSLDVETAEAIAKAVAEKGLVTAVGYHWRYLDTVDEARALLAGNPAQLLSGYWLDSTPPPQWWWHEDKSGGQMVEQTTHLLDLARFLVGEVTEVYGRAGHKDRPEFPGLDVPTVTTASLTFDTGVVANISSTCLLGWNHRVGLHIFADRLAIELTDRDIMVDVGRGRPVRGADGDPVWREDRDFVDAVRGGENRIRCPYADALATHRLAIAVVASARSGEPVRLDPPQLSRAEPAPLQFQPRHEPPQGLAPGHRHIRSLGVERPGEAYHFQYEEGPPGDGQVRLDTLYTGFSAGTELTFYKNTNPYLHSRWDAGRGVFVPGEAGQHFPVPFLGYMEVARVSEARAPGYAPGDVVASTYAHKSGHTADPFHDLLVKMPADIDPMLGIYVAQMGPIAANGLLHADAEMAGANVSRLGEGVAGRPTLVVGAGVVGLLTALFAARAGAAEIVVADPSPFRRERAEALGFTAMDEDQAWAYAKSAWHHGGGDRGADFVFQTRASAASLHAALRALRPQGTVIDLAFYQGGADAVRLGEEFHHNGLNIRCAQINRVPRGLGFAWTKRRLAAETIGLLQARGEDIKAQMITHVVPFEEAPAFLASLVAERPEFLQIVFKVQD